MYNNSFCPHNKPMKILLSLFLFFVEVWYMWYTLLVLCVQHDLTFETLQNGHHSKSSYHLSAYKVNAILLTIVCAVLFIPVTYLLCNWVFVPLDSLPLFYPSPPTHFHCFLPLATTRLFSVFKSLGFICFCFRVHMQMESCGIYLSMSDWVHLA